MTTTSAEIVPGRWVGRWFEVECCSCGCMLALRESPDGGTARCAGCRGDAELRERAETRAT